MNNLLEKNNNFVQDNNNFLKKNKITNNEIKNNQTNRIILEYYIETYMKINILKKRLDFYQGEIRNKNLLEIYRKYITKKLKDEKLQILKELKETKKYIITNLLTFGYFISKENFEKLDELWKELKFLINFY